jgi:serine phosphatase RsbU (regulator of sigma subunit)
LQIDTLDQRKRFQKEDLDVLASIAGQAGIAIDNAHLYEQALKNREMERDLELARSVQRGLVPTKAPAIAGYEFYHFYESANQVGGDYFDYVPLSGGRYAIVVADVVGHGVAAALLMARLSSQVRFCLAGGAEPGETLAQVNNAFGEMGIEGRFVTFWLGVLDPAKNTLTVANAGHMPTMIRHGVGNVTEVGEDQTGLPIGILEDVEYEQLEIDVPHGEMIVMYTDGVNEAADPADELYSIERIRERFGAAADRVPALGESIVADVRKFMNGAPQGDDMCLVCFGRTA